MLLNVVPDLTPRPSGHGAEFEQFVFPVPTHNRNVGSLLGLGATQRGDPKPVPDDVFTHRLDLANVAAHVRIVLPKHVTVSLALLFNRNWSFPSHEIQIGVFLGQLFSKLMGLWKKESGVDACDRQWLEVVCLDRFGAHVHERASFHSE